MSTSWKPQYRQPPPCQQQRKDDYLGMSPDILGLVSGVSVALFLAAMFLFPMYYMEKREQCGRKTKCQIMEPRSSGLEETCRWGPESRRVVGHACSLDSQRSCQTQPANLCGNNRAIGCRCNVLRSNNLELQSTAYSLRREDPDGYQARCSSDSMSFDITIGATRITHSQGYPSTKSELEAAETLINGLATLLNQSLKSSTPGVHEASPPSTSPSPPREQERATPLPQPCGCSSSGDEESTSAPSEVDQDVDEPSPKRDLDGDHSNMPPRKFSCPFYQRDPSGRFWKKFCGNSGFSNVNEVRKHIYDHHIIPFYCSRCAAVFPSQKSLHDHLLEPIRCEVISPVLTMGCTRQQRKDMRKLTHGTEERQWRAIYSVLFPDPSEAVPSPCKCFLDQTPCMSAAKLITNAQQQHFRLQLPHVLDRRFVENPTNSESETPIADPTARNRPGESGDRATVDVLRGAQTELYRNFRPIRQLTIDDFYDSTPLSPGAPSGDQASQDQPDDSRERQHSHDSSDLGVLTGSSRSGSIQSSGFVYASDEFSLSETEDRGTFFQRSGADRS
ncbi:hypothetical protein BDP55DRAFT_709333 [Colletotrichum godetiae]|uniref:C2H2-type domain-containing protein n=1 Tax=Colletotrichum godetiae TaxID=1209918 RepID=A0AAJ0B1K9_9PEZI|nr:uncharacterized protein BDP55DRAFT_709333 [Colletotrichum godetiae]KAK1700941.1 hypothetical protein BDP55DRAFT_709333 [Colletotrichum godetiae]